MLEILTERRKQLLQMHRRKSDIEIVIRLRENDNMIKRYKKLIEAEVDAAGFREELTSLAKSMDFLSPVGVSE